MAKPHKPSAGTNTDENPNGPGRIGPDGIPMGNQGGFRDPEANENDNLKGSGREREVESQRTNKQKQPKSD